MWMMERGVMMMAAGVAFRRSNLMLRSPPGTRTSPLNGSGAARSPLGGARTVPSSTLYGAARANVPAEHGGRDCRGDVVRSAESARRLAIGRHGHPQRNREFAVSVEVGNARDDASFRDCVASFSGGGAPGDGVRVLESAGHLANGASTAPGITSDVASPKGALTGAATERSPTAELIRRMRKMEEDAIAQCQVELSSMQRTTNRQRNISNDVKLGISKMAELLDVMLNYRRV